MNQIQSDLSKIATDVVTVGASVSAVLATIVNVAPSVHIPANATALIVSVSTVLATVIAEARRFVRAKAAK